MDSVDAWDGLGCPDPSEADTAADFVTELNRLRVWAGRPSLRALRDIAASRHPADVLPASTVHEILAGRRLPRMPRLEFVEAYVRACLRANGVTNAVAEAELQRWRRSWRRLAAGPTPTPGSGSGSGTGTGTGTGTELDTTEVDAAASSTRPVAPKAATRRASSPATAVAFFLIGLLIGVFGATHALTDVAVSAPPPAPTGSACRSTTPLPLPGTELITNGTFDTAVGHPWWINSVKADLKTVDGALVVHVMGGTANPWDVMVVHSHLRLRPAEQYTLAFRAAASVPVRIRVTVQDSAPPEFAPAVLRDIHLGPQPCWIQLDFTGTNDTDTGKLTFQAGGHHTAFSLTLDDVSLIAERPVPPPR